MALLRRAAKKVADAEAAVSEAESALSDIEAKIAAGNVENDIFNEHQAATRRVETAMSLWELASQEFDELKASFGA